MWLASVKASFASARYTLITVCTARFLSTRCLDILLVPTKTTVSSIDYYCWKVSNRKVVWHSTFREEGAFASWMLLYRTTARTSVEVVHGQTRNKYTPIAVQVEFGLRTSLRVIVAQLWSSKSRIFIRPFIVGDDEIGIDGIMKIVDYFLTRSNEVSDAPGDEMVSLGAFLFRRIDSTIIERGTVWTHNLCLLRLSLSFDRAEYAHWVKRNGRREERISCWPVYYRIAQSGMIRTNKCVYL